MINKIKGRVDKEIKKTKKAASWYYIKFYPDSEVRKLVRAFEFIIKKKKWQDDEVSCLQSIEQLRNRYLSSNETVLVRDFGAGSPDLNRTEEQIENGVVSEKNVSEIYRIAASPPKWGELIFKIIRIIRPENCLELGTSLGVSAAYQISALKLNHKGKLTTIEGAKELAKIADRNLEKFNFRNYHVQVGKFIDVLPLLLSKNNLLDFVFIDGHHDKKATKEYFEVLYPFLAERAILVFDDIGWSPGMKEVWQEIYHDKRINFSFELNKWGICLVNKNNTSQKLHHVNVNL